MSSGNLLFMLVLFLGPLVSLSSTNWVICWVGMELSFLGAIPLMLSDSSFHSLSKESVIKYFCIQALGSGLLMFGGVLLFMDPSTSFISNIIFLTSLFVKLGMFPMHFWVPSVTAGLNWIPMFILLAWQKIPPFAFLMNILDNNEWMASVVLFFGGFTALAGAIVGMNQTSFRAMLGSSSIAHTGWASIGAVVGGFWVYFSIYCLSFIILMAFCMVNQGSLISLGILSMSGLPPFSMFIGKWTVLKMALMSESSFMFLLLPILSALLSLFFYLKFFYSFYLSSKTSAVKPKYLVAQSLAYMTLMGVLFIFTF